MIQVYVFSYLFFLTVLWRRLPLRKIFNTCCKGSFVVCRAMELLIRCSSWMQSSNKFSPRFLPSQFNACRKKLQHKAVTIVSCCVYKPLAMRNHDGCSKRRDLLSLLTLCKVRMSSSIWRNYDDDWFIPDAELVTNTGCNAWRIPVGRYLTLWSCLSMMFRNLTIQPSTAEMLSTW